MKQTNKQNKTKNKPKITKILICIIYAKITFFLKQTNSGFVWTGHMLNFYQPLTGHMLNFYQPLTGHMLNFYQPLRIIFSRKRYHFILFIYLFFAWKKLYPFSEVCKHQRTISIFTFSCYLTSRPQRIFDFGMLSLTSSTNGGFYVASMTHVWLKSIKHMCERLKKEKKKEEKTYIQK